MKYLIICVSLALFAYINASPVYGNQGGYGGYGGYGPIPRVVYEEVRPYGGGYNNYGPRELTSYGGSRASAIAGASASAVKEGNYRQYAIPGYAYDVGVVGGHGRREY